MERTRKTTNILASAILSVVFVFFSLALSSPVLAVPTVHDPNYSIELVASGLGAACGLAIGPTGDIFLTDLNAFRILKVDRDTYAVEQYASGFSYPQDLTFDSSGNLFVLTGSGSPRDILQVYPDGSTSLFSTGYSYTVGIEAAKDDSLFLGNSGDGTISRVYPSGAGETFLSGYGGPGGPFGVAVDDDFPDSGFLYFVQHGTGQVYRSTPHKSVSLLATLSPLGVVFVEVDSVGVVYVSDQVAASIYKIHDGEVTAFASGFTGKLSGPGSGPLGLRFDTYGNLFVADGQFLWKISPSNQLPEADAGPDQVVFDEVTLDGSESYDLDGTIEYYEWVLRHKQDSAYDRTAEGVNPVVVVSGLEPGFYDVTLTVTDNDGATDTDTMLLAAAGKCSSDPTISGICPPKAKPRTIVSLYGCGFGDTQQDSAVHIGSIILGPGHPKIKFWSDTRVKIGMLGYKCRWFRGQKFRWKPVWITVDGVDSNKKWIKVMKPAICP